MRRYRIEGDTAAGNVFDTSLPATSMKAARRQFASERPGWIVRKITRTADEPSVNDIPDNELLQRVLRHLARRGRRREKVPLWSIVSDHFALGSGFSGQLCRRFGLDPDQIVRK